MYVPDGELTVRRRGDAFTAAAGSFVFLPRGGPHRFWTPGPPARLLLIAVPGGIEDYFLQINAAASDQERRQVGERYGIPSCPDRQPKPATAIAGPARLSGISTCWRASKSSTHLPVPSTTDSSGFSAR